MEIESSEVGKLGVSLMRREPAEPKPVSGHAFLASWTLATYSRDGWAVRDGTGSGREAKVGDG